ncbi:hypothetical protein [Haladaptatus sp. NG-SE-30]
MPSNSRRAFLGTVSAALVGVTGCLGDTSTGVTDEPASTASTQTTQKTTTRGTTSDTAFTLPESSIKEFDGMRVAVANVTVQKSVAYKSIMGSGGVLAPENRQFVVAAVQSRTGATVGATGDPPYESFELVVDGDVYPATEIEPRTTGAYTRSLAGRGQTRYGASYASEGSVGWIAFEPPSPLEADEATIRCRPGGDSAEWSIPDEQVGVLPRRSPSFELRSFEATVREASVELSLVAENVSQVDGRFLAAVYWPTSGIADDDESTIVARSVAAGDRIEWAKSFKTRYSGGQDGTVTARVEGVVTGEKTVDLGT